MANKRDIKKDIKKASNRLIEDAFYQILDAAEKEAKKMDKVIDKIVDERFDLIRKVNQYPKKNQTKKVKAHFTKIKQELNKMVDEYTKKIGKVA